MLLNEKYQHLLQTLENKKIPTNKKYNELFQVLKMSKAEEDNELTHILIDTILNTFLNDITEKKLKNITEIQKISKKITTKIKTELKLWYC